MGLALDSVEHFGESELRIKRRSVPNSEIKLVLSGKRSASLFVDVNGNWEFFVSDIKFNNYILEIDSLIQNNILSLKTKILNGSINEKLF